MSYLDVYDLLTVTFLLFLPVSNHLLPLELFVYLHLIIGILSLRTFAHLTVLPLFNPALNLTFSLLPITSSHPHASASDSTFDFWRYINIWLTLTCALDNVSSYNQYIVSVNIQSFETANFFIESFICLASCLRGNCFQAAKTNQAIWKLNSYCFAASCGIYSVVYCTFSAYRQVMSVMQYQLYHDVIYSQQCWRSFVPKFCYCGHTFAASWCY